MRILSPNAISFLSINPDILEHDNCLEMGVICKCWIFVCGQFYIHGYNLCYLGIQMVM